MKTKFKILKSEAMVLGVALFLVTGPRVFAASQSPERVISLNVCTDELAVSLASPGQIKGLSRFARDPRYSNVSTEAKKYPSLKGDAEEVIALAPDLVLTSVFSQKETSEFLKGKGIRVQTLGIPEDFSGIRENIIKSAEALGNPEKGLVMIQEWEARMAAIPKDPLRAPRVIFFYRGGQTAGKNTFENAVIEAAGGRNLAAEMGMLGHGYISLEHLIAEKPDILIFSDDRGELLSLGHEILMHPAVRRGLPDTHFAVIPSVLLNCGNLHAAKAVEKLSLMIRVLSKKGL